MLEPGRRSQLQVNVEMVAHVNDGGAGGVKVDRRSGFEVYSRCFSVRLAQHQHASSIDDSGRPLPVLECPLGVELHERAHPCSKRRAATRHRGGLHGLEQLAFGRTMLNGPAHMG